jgi:hypothetical protein
LKKNWLEESKWFGDIAMERKLAANCKYAMTNLFNAFVQLLCDSSYHAVDG